MIDHCVSVTKLALRFARILKIKGNDLDIKLVEAGALFHDIGRSKTHSVHHGAIGGQIVRKIGLSEELARIVERHVGAGIPRREAEKLGLPKGEYIPKTLEERVVSYADKLIEGGKEVDIQVTIDQFINEHGDNHISVKRLKEFHEKMTNLLEIHS